MCSANLKIIVKHLLYMAHLLLDFIIVSREVVGKDNKSCVRIDAF